MLTLKALRSQIQHEIGDAAGRYILPEVLDVWIDECQEQVSGKTGLLDATWEDTSVEDQRRYPLPPEYVYIHPNTVIFDNRPVPPATVGQSVVFDQDDDRCPRGFIPTLYDIWNGYIRFNTRPPGDKTFKYRGLRVPNPLTEDADISEFQTRFKNVLICGPKAKALDQMALIASRDGVSRDHLQQLNMAADKARMEYSVAVAVLDNWTFVNGRRGILEMM